MKIGKFRIGKGWRYATPHQGPGIMEWYLHNPETDEVLASRKLWPVVKHWFLWTWDSIIARGHKRDG